MGNSDTKKAAKSQLDENEIEFFISNTNFNRAEVLQWYEGFISDCPTGKLNQKDFEKVFIQLYPNGEPSKFSKYVFEVFDLDNNGYISFTEFLLSTAALTSGDLSKKLSLVFRIYDINKNHSIDLKELTKLIEAVFDLKGVSKETRTGDLSPTSKAQSIFQKLDIDHSQTISEDEFVNGILKDEFLYEILMPK